MCIYYPKVTLSLLCVNIVFNFLELFSWLPKTTGNIRPLPLNWLKDLGVGIAINFHPSFCVVPQRRYPPQWTLYSVTCSIFSDKYCLKPTFNQPEFSQRKWVFKRQFKMNNVFPCLKYPTLKYFKIIFRVLMDN